MRLILTEKPSVARDIARVLGIGGRRTGYLEGAGTRITWCLGHLVELAEPETYDPAWKRWDLATLPMLPERFGLVPRTAREDQWQVVRGLLTDPATTDVVNACDAGREGELIFDRVRALSGCAAPVQRLWISALTDAAITAGMQQLRPGASMAGLAAAARCRAEADWLVGLNATRAMTLTNRRAGGDGLLSLGRVQTPTLAMLCDREDEIEAFEPRPFWQVTATLEAPAGTWQATWHDGKTDRLEERAAAEAIVARLTGATGAVSEVERKVKREPPPRLFDLTTLQREANRRLGLTAAQTLDVAQSLYERHKLLTYPRTDARVLGSTQAGDLPGVLTALGFGPYAAAAAAVQAGWPPSPLPRRVFDDAEVGDHPAIIPTAADPRRARLTPDEKRVYDLVARRLLAALGEPAVFATARVVAQVGAERLLARGRIRLEAGWQAIEPPPRRKDAAVELPAVETGDPAAVAATELKEGKTKPPPRFNDASLLGAMERAGESLDERELKRAMKDRGLGTPATRAAIMETLLSRGYLSRDGKWLTPTARGRALVRAIAEPALRSPRLTGEWEARLAAVADGRESAEAFMAAIRAFTAELVTRTVAAEPGAPIHDDAPAATGPPLGACPRCDDVQVVDAGRRGWLCPGCRLRIPKTVASRDVSPRMARALLKDGRTAAVKGFKSRAGKPFSAALVLDGEGGVGFEFPDPDPLGDCPVCGEPVRRRGKVYTCDRMRACPFVVWLEIDETEIPEQAVRELLADGQRSGPLGDDATAARPVLSWTGQRVQLIRVDPRETAGPAGPCPDCGADVVFGKGRWRCGGCRFSLPGEVMQRPLRAAEVEMLLRVGQTPRLHGFRQTSGAYCKAALVRSEGPPHVRVEFAGGEDPPLPAGGPPPAFGKRVDCPLCVDAGQLDPGYLVRGRQAWGCSAWARGCPLRIPFTVDGRPMADDEVRRAFGRQRMTVYLKGFLAKDGLPRGEQQRLVIDAEAEHGWRLQTRG